MTIPELSKRLTSIVVSTAIISTQLLASGAPARTSAIDMLTQKAQSLEARGRDDLAAQVWQQVLVANPNQPTALAHLARWAKRNGQNDRAAALLQTLKKVDPNSAELQLTETDPLNKAKSRLDEAARLAATERYDDAMRIYREVFGAAPPAGTWAVSYYETLAGTSGGIEAAISGLRSLTTSYPNVPDYQLALGRLLTYRPATRLEGVKLLASVNGSTLQAAKAKAAWRQALQWEKLNPAYAQSAELYLSHYPDSDIELATKGMRTREVASSVPSRPEDKDMQLGYTALKKGSLDEAERHFREALKAHDESGRAHAGLGFVEMKRGNFDSAVHQFEIANFPGAGSDVRSALHEAKFWKTMHSATAAMEAQEWTTAAELYQSALEQRPASNEALSSVGGALLAAQQPARALPYLKKLVAQQPGNELGWCNLVQAEIQSGAASSALRTIASVPVPVATGLSNRIEWKALQSLAYHASGNNERAIVLYREVLSAKTDDVPADVQVQLASLSLELKQTVQAASFARRAIELSPKNTGAWEVLFSTLVNTGQQIEAQRVYDQMPASVQGQASAHPGFQQALASFKEASGDLEGARLIVEALAKSSGQLSKEARTEIELHQADLDVKLGNTQDAVSILDNLATSQPDNPAVWRSRLFLFNRLNQPTDLLSTYALAPQAVAAQLRQQGDVVSILASANAATGRPDYAIHLLETYNLRGGSGDAAAKAPQRLQLAWLLLDEPNSSAYLYRVLDELNRSSNLSTDARKQVADLWSTWILRTAEKTRKLGDTARALAILEQGARAYPSNPTLQSAFAGNLLSAGQTKRAFNVYANWGLSGAQPDDYAGAIGAALSEHKTQDAGVWVNHALERWPANPKILSLAGDLAQTRGDLKHARVFWKEALTQKETQTASTAGAPTLDERAAATDPLRSLLVTENHSKSASQPDDTRVAADRPVEVHLSSFTAPGSGESFLPAAVAEFAATAPVSAAPLVRASAPPLADALQDKLASLESRNTPYLGSNMSVWERGGQSGFSRLAIEQAEFEASTTIADTFRASLLVRPTYLSGGTADGSGTALFGHQTAPQSFGPQSASGVAGEFQLSSQWLGLRFGSTPRGFLTNDWVGGLRLQPWNDHISLLFNRDEVKDTLLSFAGARDPQSGKIWGGVLANSASLDGHWGDANSGMYASGGYQRLDGHNVAQNNGANGNVGVWWKLATLREGALTVGLNFSAMHYDRNLRYFTFGQGGYFSPQQYFLFNAPVRWSGTHGRLQYTVAGSLGLQHFTEDSSDYYPVDTSLQKSFDNRYPALVSTGANFSFDSRISYQLAPHWMAGAFVAANNARDYTAASGGIFVKYTFEERPLNFLDVSPSVPNWRGQQPF